MKRVELQQNTDEWLAWRSNHLGASDTPIIFDASPFKTPLELYKEKTGEVDSKFDTFVTSRGHALEPTALMFYTNHTGLEMKPQCFVSNDYPWLAASLDGWNEKKRIHVEIKCPGEHDWKLAEKGEVPYYYYLQIQHQMLVMKTHTAHYYVFNGMRGRLITVTACETTQNEIIQKTKEFKTMIETLQPPPLSSRDYLKEESEDLVYIVTKLRETRNNIKSLEERKKYLENDLASLCTHPRTEIDGMKIIKTTRKGMINYKKISEDHINLDKINLEAYRRESSDTVTFKDTKV